MCCGNVNGELAERGKREMCIPRSRISIDQTCLINLEPVKSSRIHDTAITRTFCQIRENRSFVAGRPFAPEQPHFIAGINGDASVGRLCAFVASNGCSVVFGRRDEAEILVQR